MQALREKGAVKLQLAGTKSADQALLALRDLNLQYSQLDWTIFHQDFRGFMLTMLGSIKKNKKPDDPWCWYMNPYIKTP